MWFVIFGQFFDHGLDFIGKTGIQSRENYHFRCRPTIPCTARSDRTGQPVHSLTVTRRDGQQSGRRRTGPGSSVRSTTSATVNGPDGIAGTADDVYAVPQYTNHTSPFIDQRPDLRLGRPGDAGCCASGVEAPNHPGHLHPGRGPCSTGTRFSDGAGLASGGWDPDPPEPCRL